MLLRGFWNVLMPGIWVLQKPGKSISKSHLEKALEVVRLGLEISRALVGQPEPPLWHVSQHSHAWRPTDREILHRIWDVNTKSELSIHVPLTSPRRSQGCFGCSRGCSRHLERVSRALLSGSWGGAKRSQGCFDCFRGCARHPERVFRSTLESGMGASQPNIGISHKSQTPERFV